MANYYPIRPGSVPMRPYVPGSGLPGAPRFLPGAPSNLSQIAPPFSETGLTPRMGSVPDYYPPSTRAPSGTSSIPRFVPQDLSIGNIFPDLFQNLPNPDVMEPVLDALLPDAPSWLRAGIDELAHLAFPELRWLDLLWLAFQLWRSWNRPASAGAGPTYVGFNVTAVCSSPRSGSLVRESYNGLIGGFTPRHAAVGSCTVLAGQSADQPPTSSTLGIVDVIHTNSGPPFFTLQSQYVKEYVRSVGGTVPLRQAWPTKIVYGEFSFPEGTPSGWTPGALESAFPALAPMVQAQPEPVPAAFLPAFDALAAEGVSPWVMREVGPESVSSFQWRALQLAMSAPLFASRSQWGPMVEVQPWLPPQVAVAPAPAPRLSPQEQAAERPSELADPAVGSAPGVEPLRRSDLITQPVPVRLQPIRFGPPRGRVREAKLRAPLALIHALAVSTYLGGTIRNLWQSLPSECKSKIRRNPRTGRYGKRKYSSMLSDIHKCLGHLDWGKFAILEGEMLLKYAGEGYMLSQMNRITPQIGGGPMVGIGTQVMHNTGGLPSSGYDPQAGGAFAGRQSPFAPIDDFQRHLNAWLGLR